MTRFIARALGATAAGLVAVALSPAGLAFAAGDAPAPVDSAVVTTSAASSVNAQPAPAPVAEALPAPVAEAQPAPAPAAEAQPAPAPAPAAAPQSARSARTAGPTMAPNGCHLAFVNIWGSVCMPGK